MWRGPQWSADDDAQSFLSYRFSSLSLPGQFGSSIGPSHGQLFGTSCGEQSAMAWIGMGCCGRPNGFAIVDDCARHRSGPMEPSLRLSCR